MSSDGKPRPTLLLPGVLGASGSEGAWRRWVVPYLESPLAIEDRVALLCAALERRDGTASPLHATGLTLLGQDRLVDLAAAWVSLASSPGGRAVLAATVRIGAGHEPAPGVLAAANRHLGARAGAWRDVLALATWAETLRRCLAGRVHPTTDPRLDAWLALVVAAGPVLEAAVPDAFVPAPVAQPSKATT